MNSFCCFIPLASPDFKLMDETFSQRLFLADEFPPMIIPPIPMIRFSERWSSFGHLISFKLPCFPMAQFSGNVHFCKYFSPCPKNSQWIPMTSDLGEFMLFWLTHFVDKQFSWRCCEEMRAIPNVVRDSSREFDTPWPRMPGWVTSWFYCPQPLEQVNWSVTSNTSSRRRSHPCFRPSLSTQYITNSSGSSSEILCLEQLNCSVTTRPSSRRREKLLNHFLIKEVSIHFLRTT